MTRSFRRWGRVSTPEEELGAADMRWISKFPDEQEWLIVPFRCGNFSASSASIESRAGSQLSHQRCAFLQ